MTKREERDLLTVGDIASRLGIPAARVDYALRTYRIKETQRAGIIRLFDDDSVSQIERALRRIAGRAMEANHD